MKNNKTSSQAFQMIPRKAINFFKTYEVSSKKKRGKQKMPRVDYLRSQNRNLHIPQIYCDTFLPTNS